MAVRLVVGAIGAIAAFVAAACWFYSATMAVPDNIDAIVEALKRIAWWNAAAAAASCVAGLLGCVLFILGTVNQVSE